MKDPQLTVSGKVALGVELTITIPMRPIGKARARVTRKGVYTPPKTALAEEDIAKHWLAAKHAQFAPGVPLRMTVIATFQRKKGDPQEHMKKPDLDNIWKLCADGLNGVAFGDDKQIVEAHCFKLYGDKDSLEIHLGPVE